MVGFVALLLLTGGNVSKSLALLGICYVSVAGACFFVNRNREKTRLKEERDLFFKHAEGKDTGDVDVN